MISETPTVRPDIATTILDLMGRPCVFGRPIARVGAPAGAPAGRAPGAGAALAAPAAGGGVRTGAIAPADVELGPLATGTEPVDFRA